MNEKLKAAAKTSERKSDNAVSRKPETTSSPSVNSPIEQILTLQRTIGNQALQRVFKSDALQAKLKIAKANDIYEQEADRVAEQVMRMPESIIQSKPISPFAKGFSYGNEDAEGESIQKQSEEKKDEKPIMTKTLSHGTLQVAESFNAGLNHRKGISLLGNSTNREMIQRLSIRDQGIPPHGWSLVPENEISRLVSAREIVERVLVRQGSWRREGPCFRHFRENCPGGGEDVFREVFYAANLWRNPSARRNLYGQGELGKSNISYTQRAYREGIWTLAGTIVHELMHNCGVTNERICEEALRHCGRLPQVPVGQRDTGGIQPEQLGFPFFRRLLNSIATDQGLSLTFIELSPGSSELYTEDTNIFYNPDHQYWQDATRADLEVRAEEIAERWFRSRQ